MLFFFLYLLLILLLIILIIIIIIYLKNLKCNTPIYYMNSIISIINLITFIFISSSSFFYKYFFGVKKYSFKNKNPIKEEKYKRI